MHPECRSGIPRSLSLWSPSSPDLSRPEASLLSTWPPCPWSDISADACLATGATATDSNSRAECPPSSESSGTATRGLWPLMAQDTPSREQSLKLEMGESQAPKMSEITRGMEWVIRSRGSRWDRARVTSWGSPAARGWKLRDVGVGSVGGLLTCC